MRRGTSQPGAAHNLKICVIFNPVAKGNKARHFRHELNRMGGECALKPTAGPGDAQRLAAGAVAEGFETIVAAGGDGTVNEVLNGIGDAPEGFARSCLGVLPLGTVNVFARELAIPLKLARAWDIIRRGRERRIDLPCAEFPGQDGRQRRYFAQLAGAGIDARAVELVSWRLKKKIGPLAYVVAGFNALRFPHSMITAAGEGHSLAGEEVVAGNGRFYGGNYEVFPHAALDSGRLEVCVMPRVSWFTVLRCSLPMLLRRRLPTHSYRAFQATSFTLTSPTPTPLELDGELVGHLPATFTVRPGALRVIAP